MAIFLFHLLIFTTVLLFSAECMTVNLFVETGASVDLKIQKIPVEFTMFVWKIKDNNLVRFYSKTVKPPPDSYKNRTVFNNETFTLTLKNMQRKDSGTYSAIDMGDEDKLLAEYIVSVIDAVRTPDLTVIWSSSDSCNFTCRGHNITLNVSYQNNRCSEREMTSGFSTLILHCTDNSIMCNYSNPVSWKSETQEIKQLCSQHEKNRGQHTSPRFRILWIVLIMNFYTFSCTE